MTIHTLARLPYGVDDDNRERFTAWLKGRGLRLSHSPLCLHWIAHGRCSAGWCRENHNLHHWMDHISGWTKDGKPALLLCQPYPPVNVREVAAVAVRFGLNAFISNGWYGHGSIAVELTKAGGVTP